MTLSKTFRFTLVVSAIAYSIYWFLPYSYGYLDARTGSLLSYAGYGAIYSGSESIDIAMFVVWMSSVFGMFFYRKVARCVFLVLAVANTLAVSFYGVSVETAGGAMMLDITNISLGVILSLAYYSPLKDKFY